MSTISHDKIRILQSTRRHRSHKSGPEVVNAKVLRIEAEGNREWEDVAIAELNQQEHVEVEFDSAISGYDGIWVSDGNVEFMIFKDLDEAERYAIARVKEDLDSDPSMFNEEWLDEFIAISDIDREIMAQEYAESYVEDLSDDSVVKEAEKEYEYNEIRDKIGELEDRQDALDEELGELQQELKSNPERARMDEIKQRISEINSDHRVIEADLKKAEDELDFLVNDARVSLVEKISEEWKKGLEHPVSFLVDDQGLYTREELLKQNFIIIDTQAAAEDAVRVDSAAFFLATYDFKEIELPSGAVAYRTN